MKLPEMKLPYLFFTIACIIFSYHSWPDMAYAENILENSGFEEKGSAGLPERWNVVPHHMEKGAAAQDDKNAYAGNYSLKLSPNKKNDREGFAVFRVLDPEDISGQKVTISCFVKVKGIGNNTAAILLKTDKANWLKLPGDTGGEFVPFSKTISVAKSIPEAALLIFVTGKGGSVWLDDLKLLVEKKPKIKSRKTTPGEAVPEKSPVKLGDIPATSAILFTSNRDTKKQRREIYAIDADGRNVTRITFTKRHHLLIEMDHSRRYIVATCAAEDTHKPKGLGHEDRRSLWVYDLKKKIAVRLTDPRYYAEGDSFSPDGQWIVFLMKLGDKKQTDIYKIRRDGSKLAQLTNTPMVLEGDPSWSNDGERIVFTSMDVRSPNPRFVLKTMDVNGREIKTVYDGGPGIEIKGAWPAGNYDPTWSPDDRWIVFERAVEATGGNAGSGNWHIFKIKADGSMLQDLSLAGGHADRAEYLPSFSPDGKWITFGSIYEARNPLESHIDIFTMDSSGGSLKRLTDHPKDDMGPVWIPLR